MHPATAVTLPGGALIGGRLVREATLRPLTGRLEEALAELAHAPQLSRPARVTELLCAMLADLGGEPATRERVAALGFTDREFLLLALALDHGDDQQWRHLSCSACGGRFDVGFRLSSLPLTPAGEGYPSTELVLGGARVRLRLPDGADEERVARLPPSEARRALAAGCVASIDGREPADDELARLGAADIDAIDAALETLSPQLGTTLSTACSHCGAPQTLELDAYAAALPQTGELRREIHELALRYHWSEEEILGLPRERRRVYLDLLDQAGRA